MSLRVQAICKQKKGKFSGAPGRSTRTTVRAGAKLVEAMGGRRVSFEDFAVDAAEEVIILKRAKRGYWGLRWAN